MKFKEKKWRFRQGQLRISVAGFDLQFVEQLDARDGNAGLDRRDGGIACRLDRGERADSPRNRFRNAMQLYRDLGDDAERSFRTDEQPREVITGGRFLGAARRRNELAVR